MGIPCDTLSTIEVAAGDGIDVVLADGVYTVSVEAAILAAVASDAVYADETERDAENPSPSSGDRAWITADDRLFVHDGTGWIVECEPIQIYTPTLTNITQGDGTVTGWYQRQHGQCFFQATFTMGGTSAMGTAPALGLPVEAAQVNRNSFGITIVEIGTATYAGFDDGTAPGATSVVLRAAQVSGADIINATITATLPFVWGDTDILGVGGRYRMNSLYD